MLCDLLLAKLMWMPSVYVLSYQSQYCTFLYLVPLLLNGIDRLLAHVAALFVTSVCYYLYVRA